MSLETTGGGMDMSGFRFDRDDRIGPPPIIRADIRIGGEVLDLEKGDDIQVIQTYTWEGVGISTHNPKGSYTVNNDAMAIGVVEGGGFYVVVADGIGHTGGEVARTLVTKIIDENQKGGGTLKPFSTQEGALIPVNNAIEYAGKAAHKEEATTYAYVTVLQGDDPDSIFEKETPPGLLVVWAGDASVDIIREKKGGVLVIETVTTADRGKRANIVTNAVGKDKEGKPLKTRLNTKVITDTANIVAIHIHSDGVDLVPAKTVTDSVRDYGPGASIFIIDKAIEQGAVDNLTSVVITRNKQ